MRRVTPEGLDVYTRLEGLAGQEAFLREEVERGRGEEQHCRLRRVQRELDAAWELLRERAERLGATR